MGRQPTGANSGGGSVRTDRNAWQRSNVPRDCTAIQPRRNGGGVTPYFREHDQRIKWTSEWAHANCTVCSTVKALRVRTCGAFFCIRCGVKGSNLNQLRALERRAMEAR